MIEDVTARALVAGRIARPRVSDRPRGDQDSSEMRFPGRAAVADGDVEPEHGS